MAKYQAYAEYKDSGVEFLPILPSTWKVRRVKSILDLQRTILGEKSKYYQLLSLTLRGVILRDVSGGDGKIPESFDTYQAVKKKDLVFCLFDMDETPRTVGISEHDGMITGAYNVYKVNKSSFPKFIYYYFLHLDYFKGLKPFYTGLRKVVRSDTFANIKMPCPPLAEQTQIANFLDHETAKIDHLIEKQQQLIELLKEKRQAVISHAVTKGLDPNVPMKDSGVEWLGEVPEHWQLVPLKYLCTFSGGGTPTKDNLSYWTDGNIPWVSPKDMKTFWISETQDYITEKAVKESSTNTVEQNSLLMVVRSGILQRTIPIAINTVPVTMNQDMKALKFGKRVLVEYIANLIHGNTVQLLLEWSKEGATVESIEHEYLANSLIPVPSLKEQEEITQVIAKKMKVYAELTEKAELQITLLQERRTALISAAVTGKIDVRNWQAPTVAEAHPELSA